MAPLGEIRQYLKNSSPSPPTFRQSPPSMPLVNKDSSSKSTISYFDELIIPFIIGIVE